VEREAAAAAGGQAGVTSAAVSPDVPAAWLDELAEFLAIPSISAEPERAPDVGRAVDWVGEFVERLGGTASVERFGSGLPLLVADVPASRRSGRVPTVMLYGHCDVQPVEPLSAWESDPFAPETRDGWLYARGAADDKGNFYLLLKALETLVSEGDLGVDVRVVCDGEEEVLGTSIVQFLDGDERGADACVIFDGPMPRRDLPAFKLGQRGLVYYHLEVRTGERELHSGMYGGAALNAGSALSSILATVLARAGELDAGTIPPGAAESEEWGRLDSGAEALRRIGALPRDDTAAKEFHLRTFARAAVDVHGLACGEPELQKTVLPVAASANVSVRLAAGQSPDEISARYERIVSEAAPAGCSVSLERRSATPPAVIAPDSAAIRIARDAFEDAIGTRPVLMRSGGTLPVVAALVDNGIPPVVTGFDVPEGNVHAPNERLLLAHMPLGIAAAIATLRAFAAL
jgi:acetylornithine deacetylase/succinyl-diaminopimelate desuccinylase-like protein